MSSGSRNPHVSDIDIHGPFSLEQAREFLAGFPPAGLGEMEHVYRAAHVINGQPRVISLSQSSPDKLLVEVDGEGVTSADEEEAVHLVRRIFSLTVDATPFYDRVGKADPVIGEIQRQFWGLRPVLFGSPFEALCWTIISQRISIAQAVRLKGRLAAELGPIVSVDARDWQAFPGPEILSELDPDRDAQRLRLPPVKIDRLRQLGERGAAGDFEAGLLLSLPVSEAQAWLEQSPGVGPWSSAFALTRGAGHPDLIPHGERRLTSAIQAAYALDHEPSDSEIDALAERWTGFRSWAVFLLRVGMRDER